MSHGVEYGKASYWDDRYKRDGESFDWYQRWSGLQPVVEPHLQKSSKILMIGCGNSTVSKDMHDAGYAQIVNIDISSVVIDKMKQRHPEMTWLIMDCTKLQYTDEFDCTIDKGTLDAILCGDDSAANASAFLTGVCRGLKPGGSFIEITYGQPSSRLNYLEAPNVNWTVKMETIAKPESPSDAHFVYICTRKS